MEHKKLTPQFFFLSIGILTTLIACVSAFLNLTFAALDHVFPDVLTASYQYGYASYSFDNMRSALALLIIVFPVFLTLSRFWLKAMKKEMSHWNDVVRKWVLYLILFLASVTAIVDLVTLVRYFVSGEITIRFILKVTLVLVVSGLVGWYYIRQLRKSNNERCTRWFVLVSAALVLAAIVWSFCVMGSPASQRNFRLDQRRIEDLQSIQWQVINLWQQKEKLPETLSELSNPIANYVVPQDPEFQKGNVYEYKKLSGLKFELCATFTLPIPKGWVEAPGSGGVMPVRDTSVLSMPYPVSTGAGESWAHDAGRTCFERTIDPELYSLYPKPEKR